MIDHVISMLRLFSGSSSHLDEAAMRDLVGRDLDRTINVGWSQVNHSSPIMVNVAALYERSDEAVVHEGWVSAFAAALRQGEGGAYVGFLGEEGEERVHEAYPGSMWERLAAIKGRYDRTNLFRLNQNVPPATEGRTTEQKETSDGL